MRRGLLWALISVCLVGARASAGGFASNENFIVQIAAEGKEMADRALAEEIADQASQYRRQIAREWLGEALPPSVGRTYLSVMVTDAKDLGRTWPKNTVTGQYHHVHLSTCRGGALGGTLAHEVAHVVLATRYPSPDLLPVWVVEGIASRYDAAERLALRQNILQWYARTNNWPDLAGLFSARTLPRQEMASYAVATSLTEFLLTKRDRQTFLQFARCGQHDGWDQALMTHYGIRSVQQLQTEWQAWAKHADQAKVASRPAIPSPRG
jgi:hypothetical protein